MLGKQHEQFNMPFGILASVILILNFNFEWYYIFALPICIAFAKFPDIDQANSTPREWKKIKTLFIATMTMILGAAIFIIIIGFYDVSKGNPINKDTITIASIVLVFYVWLIWYKTQPGGKFIFSHRGFTHTLVIPAMLVAIYIQLQKVIPYTQMQKIVIEATKVLVIGIIEGITGHIFLDMTCKAGVPLLYPLPIFEGSGKQKRYKRIKIGNAISGDPNVMGKPHKTAIKATMMWSWICIAIAIIIVIIKIPQAYAIIIQTISKIANK